MSLSFIKFFPKMINTIQKTSMNSRILLKRCQSTKGQENYATSEYNLTWGFDHESKPPGLNFDNLISEKDKIVLEPYNYNETVRMNSVRTALMEGYNYWLNVPNDIVNNIEEIMTMVYEMLFMFDDMDDHSEYRRGMPTGFKIFGVPRTQISARACFSIILKKLLRDFDNRKVIEIFTDYTIMYWAAAYREIDCRENLVCPTIAEYRQNCIDKSMPALGMPMELMQTFSDCKTDLIKLAQLITLHQQWQNDSSAMSEEKMWDSKGFCDDISEGKFSLTIIHAVQQDTPEGRMVFHILKQQTKDQSLLRLCYDLLKKSGSLEFAKKCVIEVEHELREEIERLGGNPILLKYIDTLNSYKNEEIILSNRSNRKWFQK